MTELGNYLIGKTIGEGTFGKVCQATHQILGHEVAVKILEKRRIHDELDVERVKREITILQMLHHPNVVQLYEMIETETHIYLFMEYADGGELFDYIDQKKRIHEVEACKFMHQIISAIQYIHQLRIVHRDLKPENLLLTQTKDILVVDFGLSNTYEDTLKTACGSPCYAAPEMIQGKPYHGLQTDLWSCGVILYAMLCGYLPFEDTNTQVLYKKILLADFYIPRYVSLDGKDLIKNILTVDPTKRFTIEQIKAHKWWQLWKSEVFHLLNQLPSMSPFKAQQNRVKCTLMPNSIYTQCVKKNIERNISEDVKTCCDTAQQSIEYQQHEKEDIQKIIIIEEEQQQFTSQIEQFVNIQQNDQLDQFKQENFDEPYEYQQSVRSLTRQKSSQSIQSIKHLHTQIDSPQKPIVVYPIKQTSQPLNIKQNPKVIPKKPLITQPIKRPSVKTGPSKSLHEPPSFDNKFIKQPNTPSQKTQNQHQQQQQPLPLPPKITHNLKTEIPKKNSNPPMAIIKEQDIENKEKSHSLKTQPTQSKTQTTQQSAKIQTQFKTPNKQPITSFSTTKRSMHQKQAASVQFEKQSFHTQSAAEDVPLIENTKIMIERFTSRLNNIKIGTVSKSNQKQILSDIKGIESYFGPYNLSFTTNRHPQLFMKGLQKYITDKYQITLNQLTQYTLNFTLQGQIIDMQMFRIENQELFYCQIRNNNINNFTNFDDFYQIIYDIQTNFKF